MVGKLMKYELKALYRVLLWFILAVVLLSGVTRIILEAALLGEGAEEGWNVGYFLSSFFSTSLWYLAVFALSVAGMIVCVVRYFRSLFTGEGYMTFSLPVTPTQLLLAKFFSALIVTLTCYAAIALSFFIAMPMDRVQQFWSDLSGALPQIFDALAAEPLFAFELVLLAIVCIPTSFLYLFLIAGIGQLFTKGRVIITIALYYGSSTALSTAFSMLLFPMIEFGAHSGHLLMWLFIIGILAFDVAAFFVTRYLLSRKVNLVV